jgi:hypothetical protein
MRRASRTIAAGCRRVTETHQNGVEKPANTVAAAQKPSIHLDLRLRCR